MRVGLTPRQLDLWEYLQDFIGREGHAPTYEQMAAHLKMTKARVHCLVSGLIERGYVSRLPNRPRGIALVDKPQQYGADVEQRIAVYCRRHKVQRETAVARAVECFFGGAA